MSDETVKLLSNDGASFYVNRDIAWVSKLISNMLMSEFKESQTKEIELDFARETLERCIEYMHYKYINSQKKQFETPDFLVDDKFDIEPEEALELLKASIFLQC